MQTGLYYSCFTNAVVILDLLPDRYRLLQGEAANRFLRLIDGTASPDDLAWLNAQGIQKDAVQQCRDSFPRPAAELTRHEGSNVRCRLLLRAIWLQHLYRLRLRSMSLHRVLGDLNRKRPGTFKPGATSIDIAAAFERAKRFVPTRDLCLPRAMAMTDMCFAAGIEVEMVFGVTLPFSAHCWVQQRDLVLTDPLDRVLPFRPIMVLS